MSHLYELHRFVLNEIPKQAYKRVLDVGCGRGIWGYLIRSEKLKEDCCIIGLDLHKPYLEHCKKYRVYDHLILCHASKLPFQKRTFDLALACDLIEHLAKPEGNRFLHELEEISDSIILSTPNGFKRQQSGNLPNTEFHRSGWSPSDFANRGYKVRGVGFKLAKIYELNPYLWGFLFYIFTPISFVFPQLGEILIAKS
jgi:2-polyprenyl-3-methyl-5-hydroxy-6-metoxy-1,4-benzoquinol methylase